MATTKKLFKVTFNYAAPNGLLRSGALIVEATNITEAQKDATEKLSGQHAHFRITGTKEY